ncbi:M1 family aminopeptidase [Hymenobacter artigasi]|uniref:ABC-type transport system involved in multi-copper enzyme maturation permease subunit n=1 Tax=Hymenobacter artigasi TaxID=2719616 RepID=A0ABX1HLU7_9BACT|nr:M1 family aminopeptidase [Hymenobacter artigasi]NKI89992.1 ABC-type transport system involved in multi-copper enzyme maturation permease subunit [Hymenobacter artigasi]
MFLPILLFELKYRLKRPATWIYFLLLFAMAFLLVTAAGGGFGTGVKVALGGDGQTVKINAPFSLNIITAVLSVFGVIIASSLMGNPVYRDFEYRTHSLFYTTPISKFGYLGGRFFGSYLISVLVFSGIGLGAAVAGMMPWVAAERFLAVAPAGTYVWPYLVLVLPNLLFSGAIFFTGATLSRNILSTYIGSVLLLVVYLVATAYLQDLKNEHLVAALDAFGISAIEFTTRYWTSAEKNSLLLPLSSYVLLNRAVWLAVGLGLLGLCYARFRFSAFASDKPDKKSRRVAAADALAAEVAPAAQPGGLRLPRVAQVFSGAMSLRQWWSLTKLEFRGIVRSRYFLAIAGAGVILLLATSSQVGRTFDTATYPVTYEVLQAITGSFFLFFLAIIIFYSGELVWREREAGVAQITDAVPVPSWVPFLSKLAALGLVQVVLLAVVMVCGLLIQTFKGYFHYEIGQYLQALFLYELPFLLLLCVLSMVTQVVVNNKYLGFAVMVMYYVANIFRSQIGFGHRLLGYGGGPTPGQYSDMNGYAHFLPAFWWTKLLWFGVALLLVLLASLLWTRGTDTTGRLREARRRWSAGSSTALALGLLISLDAGGYIFYNTNVLNKYMTPKEGEKRQVAYEKQYRRLKDVAQPRITAVDMNTEIFPSTRAVRFQGQFTLVNKHARALDTVIVSIPVEQNPRVHSITLGQPGQATLALNDTTYGVRLYRLARPLAPGDSLALGMDILYQERGFPSTGSNTDIVYNGTFISSNYLPGLGYREGAELSGDQDRKNYGLKPKPRMAPVNDLQARQNTYISQDADWIRFRTTVSTEADQTAIAPGYLQKEWVKDGRRYFTYVMDRPMLNFYTFLSARYKEYKSQWVDTAGQRTIPITIYYQPGHEYNLKRMAEGARDALAYCSKNFSPYQHRQLRILEFPRYQSFAQSFANTVPFSEAIGFIANVNDKDPEDLNYPYYVTAHEVGHQWWAHQVIGGNVQGSTLLAEAMAEYSALMVLRAHNGPATMQRFLKFDMNRYLTGRAFEQKKEVPLALVENQQYIHYAKGSVVMYGLQDYLGEATLNAALKKYVAAVAYQQPPYTNSTEFIGYLRRAAPDSLQSYLTDQFERITLYDNRVTAATSKKLPDGRYQVDFTVKSAKFYADSLGTQRPADQTRDALPVAIFPEMGKDKQPVAPLLLQKRRLRPGDNQLRYVVSKKPASVAIDPYHLLMDRQLDDNTKDL